MRLWVICFTPQGAALCRRLLHALPGDIQAQGYGLGRFLSSGDEEIEKVSTSLSQWAQQAFEEAQSSKMGLLFIGACGIAVRAIAPYLKGKDVDPAVVVMDEKGQYAVSLLSGHLGGANGLAAVVARTVGAVPVISTATDVNRTFAVDSFAAKNNLRVLEVPKIKLVSSAILRGEPVGLYSQFPVLGEPPPVFAKSGVLAEKTETGVYIGFHPGENPFPQTVHLLPRLTLGLGCRRGVSCQQIEEAVLAALAAGGIAIEAVSQICSIVLKKDEEGLLAFSQKYALPILFFTAEQLLQAEPPQGQQFAASPFVSKITGVENVCERAAVLGSGGGRLYLPKRAHSGVTVAAAGKIELQWE